METFLALFRGVNVGGKRLIPMKSLASLLEKNHFINVKTYIQTGNVIFQSDSKPENLDELIEANFGFKPDVLILTKSEFAAIVANNPYSKMTGREVHFYFCKTSTNADIDRIETIKAPSEQYQILNNTFYLHAPDGIGRSKLVANIEKCLATSATGRNLNTVNKLVTLLNID